jgi:hypothetical protein
MKKFLGILFLLVIIAAGVCAYIFPGTPYYYKCTHELHITDNIWEKAPEGLPKLSEGFADFSSMGVRITAWNDMETVNTGSKENVTWQNDNGSHSVSISVEHLSENDDFLDRTGITPEELDQYCKNAEKTTPENKYEFVKLFASLTMDDFDIHNFKNSKTFYKLMLCKDDLYSAGEVPIKIYPVDGVGFRGYLLTEQNGGQKNAVINIYPEKDKKTRYIIELSVTDWNEILAIANSIKLT